MRIGRVLEAHHSGESGMSVHGAKSMLHSSSPEPVVPRYYISFNGTSSRIDCGSDASLDNIPSAGTFTVDTWFRLTALKNVQTIACKGVASGVGWWFECIADPTPAFVRIRGLLEANVHSAISASGEILAAGSWYHGVLCLYTDNKLYLALNGTWCTYYGSQEILDTYGDESGDRFWIGYDGGVPAGGWLYGDISWLRISSGLRWTPGVNFTAPAMCAPPAVDGNTIELWAMDEGAGLSTTASVNNPANDGTGTNIAWGECT